VVLDVVGSNPTSRPIFRFNYLARNLIFVVLSIWRDRDCTSKTISNENRGRDCGGSADAPIRVGSVRENLTPRTNEESGATVTTCSIAKIKGYIGTIPRMANELFIDFYELMQVSPSAELETIERVYRFLANRYRPDNPRTADAGRFTKLTQAYQVLSCRETRAAYDSEHKNRSLLPLSVFESKEFAPGIEGEPNRRMGILCVLYNRRRTSTEAAGMSILDLESVMSFPREHLIFPLWFLKEADLIRQDERSNFVITLRGVESVEHNLSSTHVLRELIKASELGEVERRSGDAAPQDRGGS
jgi:curved DNA-binding protein